MRAEGTALAGSAARRRGAAFARRWAMSTTGGSMAYARQLTAISLLVCAALVGCGDGEGVPASNDEPSSLKRSEASSAGQVTERAALGNGNGGLAACGNGVTNPKEECDDGNNIDGDGCSATCTIE